MAETSVTSSTNASKERLQQLEKKNHQLQSKLDSLTAWANHLGENVLQGNMEKRVEELAETYKALAASDAKSPGNMTPSSPRTNSKQPHDPRWRRFQSVHETSTREKTRSKQEPVQNNEDKKADIGSPPNSESDPASESTPDSNDVIPSDDPKVTSQTTGSTSPKQSSSPTLSRSEKTFQNDRPALQKRCTVEITVTDLTTGAPGGISRGASLNSEADDASLIQVPMTSRPRSNSFDVGADMRQLQRLKALRAKSMKEGAKLPKLAPNALSADVEPPVNPRCARRLSMASLDNTDFNDASQRRRVRSFGSVDMAKPPVLSRRQRPLSASISSERLEAFEALVETKLGQIRPQRKSSQAAAIPRYLHPEFFHLYFNDHNHTCRDDRNSHQHGDHGSTPPSMRTRSHSVGASDANRYKRSPLTRTRTETDAAHLDVTSPVTSPIPECRIMSSLRPSTAVNTFEMQTGEQGLASWCGVSKKTLGRIQARHHKSLEALTSETYTKERKK